jgi:hypothetical protein
MVGSGDFEGKNTLCGGIIFRKGMKESGRSPGSAAPPYLRNSIFSNLFELFFTEGP